MSFERSTFNRTQQLILAFFVFAWLALIVIVRVAPLKSMSRSCTFLAVVSVEYCPLSPSWLPSPPSLSYWG